MNEHIVHHSITTPSGNEIQFFYNPENSLICIDLIHSSGNGGNEIFRKTIDEKALLIHLDVNPEKETL